MGNILKNVEVTVSDGRIKLNWEWVRGGELKVIIYAKKSGAEGDYDIFLHEELKKASNALGYAEIPYTSLLGRGIYDLRLIPVEDGRELTDECEKKNHIMVGKKIEIHYTIRGGRWQRVREIQFKTDNIVIPQGHLFVKLDGNKMIFPIMKPVYNGSVFIIYGDKRMRLTVIARECYESCYAIYS